MTTWTGGKFQFVRVRLQNGEVVVLPGRYAWKLPYTTVRTFRGREYWRQTYAEMSYWVQPESMDPTYYGNVPLVFRGTLSKHGKPSRLDEAQRFVQRLLDQIGIPRLIKIIVVRGDIAVLVHPKAFGLRPSEMFPSQCARIANELLDGDLMDKSIYHPDAMITIPGSKTDENQWATWHVSRDFLTSYVDFGHRQRHHFVPPDWLSSPRHDRPPLVFDGSALHPFSHPVSPALRSSIPKELEPILKGTVSLPQSEQEPLCFGIGLLVKDLGGTLEDALVLLKPVRLQLTEEQIRQSLGNAFGAHLQFGKRALAQKCPSIGIETEPETQYVTFQRSFLKLLIDMRASYNAHGLLYHLLLSFYRYNRLELELPDWSRKVLGPAVRALEEIGAVERMEGHRVRYKINHEDLATNYIRVPAHLIETAMKAGKAVSLFSALLKSSGHKTGLMKTRIKRDTLAAELAVTSRTIDNYLRSLREAGLDIDEQFCIHYVP